MELFDWIKAVVWTIEQNAIKAARKRNLANPNSKSNPASAESQPPTTLSWTPKRAPDAEKMRAMMKSVGVDVEPA